MPLLQAVRGDWHRCRGFWLYVGALWVAVRPGGSFPRWAGCWVGLVTCAIWPVTGAEPGSEVVVVYNRRVSPDSRQVATHYAERRGVPARQLVGLDMPEAETITRAEFAERIQKPLLQELEERKLVKIEDEISPASAGKPGEVLRRLVHSTVRYVVPCYGTPLRIAPDPALAESGIERVPSELRRNGAAVDSELTVLPIQVYRPSYHGPMKNPFYLSTNALAMHPTNGLFLVGRLDGPSAAIARGLVDKAIEAETNGLWGRAYFDARGLTNGAYRQGDEWIRAAFQVARRSGFESVLDEKPETFPTAFPMSQVALYAGWYDSQVSGPFAQPKVEFMPGAIAYHLHSYSAGSVRTATQHWVGPLLAKGATATLGCVDEPYLTYTPDLGVLFSRLIQWAFSFGEAAYAAQRAVSWQITVIGDPLYRPFGQKPQVMQEELERRESPLLEWCHLRRVNVSLATDLPVADLVLYLEQLPLTRRSALLEQKLGELQLRQGQKDEAVTEFQKALRLQPSPQQRIQLQLTLAGTLAELARETESLEVYRELLKETPNYPDLLGIYQKMLALARKSGNEEVSRRCEAELMRLSGQKPAL